MYDYINYLEIPLLIIATKLDKIAKNKRQQHVNQIKKAFGENEDIKIIPFSSETSENKDAVWKEIIKYI